MDATTANRENLGPAERIINALLSYTDHALHNRPGVVVRDPAAAVGVSWAPVTHKIEGEEKKVYRLDKRGQKTVRVPLGVLQDNGEIRDGTRVVGEYRSSGLFSEVATWMYRQVAEVWKLDNEFAAHWASYAYGQEHRDLKVVLAAFMLVQSRKGDPVEEGGKVLFRDEDYRDVGEAMMLLTERDLGKGKADFGPKLLLRVRDVLALPAVAEINRQLGFGKSARHPFFGRWEKAVEKWLRYREENEKMLAGLVKSGYRTTVIDLARRIGYKPTSPRFFEILRWKQTQSGDGRRQLAIGAEMRAAETWEGMTERQICERIVAERPGFKRLSGLLPKSVGLTRAIMAAAIEANALSSKDLIILAPTLEELGLLAVPEIRARFESAVKAADDTRASNIAQHVKSKEVKDLLAEASDMAVKKAVEEVMRNMRAYFMIDISGSMEHSIETAKGYLAQFVQGFPLDRIHVAVFSTCGREVAIKHSSAAGVEQAFRGITAGGGTAHRTAIDDVLRRYPPKDDEDSILVICGDGGENGSFAAHIRNSGLRPMAIGFLRVPGQHGNVVESTARDLSIPCFMIDEKIFADPYAIPRTIRALVAATPVGVSPAPVQRRETLVMQILKTAILTKPVWAA